MNDSLEMPPLMKTCWDCGCGLVDDPVKPRSVLCPQCTDLVEPEDRRWAISAWAYLAKQLAPNQQHKVH